MGLVAQEGLVDPTNAEAEGPADGRPDRLIVRSRAASAYCDLYFALSRPLVRISGLPGIPPGTSKGDAAVRAPERIPVDTWTMLRAAAFARAQETGGHPPKFFDQFHLWG